MRLMAVAIKDVILQGFCGTHVDSEALIGGAGLSSEPVWPPTRIIGGG